jgi:Dna[CI] antecedent, DciA
LSKRFVYSVICGRTEDGRPVSRSIHVSGGQLSRRTTRRSYAEFTAKLGIVLQEADSQIANRTSKIYRDWVIPVSQVLPSAVAEILRKAPLTPQKVAFAWRTAVGPAVDKASVVVLRDNVLQVRVRDARWQREVERSAALIRARLEMLLGNGVVRYIDVTTDAEPPSAGG